MGCEEIVAVLFYIAFGEFGLIFPEAFHFSRNDQIFVLAKGNAVVGREFLRAFRNEIHVRALAQNLARGADGIAQALDTANAAPSKRGTIHDEGVKLHATV